jgi:hypothetical protein
MVNVDHDDELLRERLEIARLLDERYRLREDPDRRSDLQRTHEQLAKLLHDSVVAVAESDEH